jgi:type VI secretion system protein ImpJ
MVWHDKVVWQEGMFLRAQHFQQQDRHAATSCRRALSRFGRTPGD